MEGKRLAQTPRLSSNWSDLNDDLLISILARLSPLEIICTSMVCFSWNRIVRSSSHSRRAEAPWLLLPSETEEGEDFDGCRFFNVEEPRERTKIYKLKNRVCKDFGKRRCIGSSHGWLILLDHERSCPFLLNPFSSTRIPLPPPETIPDILGYLDGEGYYVVDISNTKRFIPIKELRDGFFHKAILSSNPYLQKKYGAIVIYNDKSKLAFWKHGEVAWHNFNGARQSGYSDVICTADNRVYALSTFTNNYAECTVEAWDFKQHVPVMLTQVTAALPGQLKDISTSVVVNSYLVESLGSILLVVRYICILRNLTKTLHLTDLFAVYKMDFELRQWTDVDRCSDFWRDRLLFLGGNHSLSLSATDFPKLNIDKGSVYYTDDFWDIIYNNNSSFVGHDLGVFGVSGQGSFSTNKSDFFALFSYNHIVRKLTKWRTPDNEAKIQPSPFWVVPKPW